MSRGVFEVEVIRPTCDATLISLAGGLNEGWFSTLKNSARNSRSNRSVISVCLYNAVSQLKYPGPSRRFRAEFPYVNCAGTANAAGLNHRWVLRFSSSGLPTTSARLLGHPVTVLSNVTEYGCPLPNPKIPASCQPPRTLSATPESTYFRPCPNGRSYV